VLAFFVTGWWGVIPTQVLDGIGTGLQTVAVPGMVARSLDGTALLRSPSRQGGTSSIRQLSSKSLDSGIVQKS